ncbi:hypothetical protein [Longimicrobium sp.]|uniref:hypothetical protein n=1 Tax=Longimicrobium sp. TaxID=2029185 RepID=UPI002C4164A4|nr:hypothetical protein [Longimicrobium sp.]HSU16712.1 hypothetical protein [Longimicrobium sp.]
MKKLKLEVEELAVESFATASQAQGLGTVRGHGTFRENTCQAVNSCGPHTCGNAYCVIETDSPDCGFGGTGTCGTGGASANCATNNGALSCVGCTTQDYTVNLANDTCGACQSFGSDAPQRCPCP